MGSTTPFGPEFVKDLGPWFLNMFAEATAKACVMIWDAFMQILATHWISIGLFILFLLLTSALTAFSTGRWGWFGSVLYHFFYFGILFLIGLVFGPAVFANDYFKIVLVTLYMLCFWLVGRILKGTGLRR